MRISDTLTELIRLVSPKHVNPIGTLYGGYMLEWIVDAGTIAAMNFAESHVVLGYLDRIHFITPVKSGDVVVYRAWVVNARRSSMTTLVESYVKRPEGVQLATIARLIFVKLGPDDRPAPVGRALEPGEGWERALYQYFAKWREEVEPALRREAAEGDMPTISNLQVMPEDAIYGSVMYGGRLLYYLDQFAAIAAFNYKPNIYVTASVNAMNFRRPIYIGDIVEVRGDVVYVGKTSLEVGFRVYAYGLRGRRYVAGGYFTFVNMTGGRPTPIGEELVKDPDALKRKEENLAEAKRLKELRPKYDERVPAFADAIGAA
ncbi:MAG: acyl-CoA thioesterase [Thermoproteus sp. AZ2]|jgi:acyl-CoA hydrolase|uniref:Acyl-CoA thioesterase n=1 Tax=Thermoproteus sp. AZ2 TaxID=1609232 RepID=A0ACC6V179_9CREN